MANTHTGRGSVSLIIKKTQIKTKMLCHHESNRIVKIKKIEVQMLAEMWSNWNSHALLVEEEKFDNKH